MNRYNCLFTIVTKAQLLPRDILRALMSYSYGTALRTPPPPAPFMWKFSLVRHNSERAHNERAGEGVIFPIFPNRLQRWIFNYSTERYEREEGPVVCSRMYEGIRDMTETLCDVGGKLVFFTKASISKWVLNKYVIYTEGLFSKEAHALLLSSWIHSPLAYTRKLEWTSIYLVQDVYICERLS